tara:strand:+ start:3588 stop:3782 length:195 start_codon:yes stop_codon:yes gene_type:complete
MASKRKKPKTPNLEKLQLLAQLVDSMEIALEKLEDSYKNKEGEEFHEAKNSILGFQKEIVKQVK